MGSQISVQQTETQQKSLNDTINDMLNEVNNIMSSSASLTQTIKFNASSIVVGDGGKFDLNQTADVQMEAMVKQTSNLAADVAQNVASKFNVKDEIDNIMETSGIVLFQSQVSIQKNKIDQDFETTLQSNIESAINNTIEDNIMRDGALCSGNKNTCNNDLCCIKIKKSKLPKKPNSDNNKFIKFIKDNYIWFIVGLISLLLIIIIIIIIFNKNKNITQPEFNNIVPN